MGNDTSAPFDLEALRLPPRLTKPAVATRLRPLARLPPIPVPWLKAATEVTPTAGMVGIVLWWKRKVSKQEVVFLSPKLLKQFGLSVRRGRRGLASLETISLVVVDRHKGRCPHVTIQEFKSKRERNEK